jgi:hypothetical protein
VYERITGEGSLQVLPAGIDVLHVVKAMLSVPKNSRIISDIAPPWTECPES